MMCPQTLALRWIQSSNAVGEVWPRAIESNVVKAASNIEDWRKKYFDSLRSLESEEQRFRVMEAALKRLAGRLCIAALGQSPRLDAELKKLQAVMRREVTSDELEQLIPTLTDAIHALDEPLSATAATSASTATAAPGRDNDAVDARVRAILAAVLSELRRDMELAKQVDSLDSRLTQPISQDELPEVLSSLTEIVGQRIHRIETAKQEIEALLNQMVDRLDEISQFVADQNQNQKQSLASSESLNTTLIGEMKAMGESVESAADLKQIRVQVRSRLDTIGHHLQEFQQREIERASLMHARNDQMRLRVTELEEKANQLQHQLQDEQRLALIDVLTQVPNRLAYDKRIEEELRRWQRFAQPACIAAWDIDRFKGINDVHGHRAGDRVLLTVAKCLAGRVRATDFVARYGGEEFVMILTGTGLDNALRLIDEMRNAVARLRFHFRGVPLSVTISCGVTALLAGDTAESAFDRADKALYQAKNRGRNCCVSG